MSTHSACSIVKYMADFPITLMGVSFLNICFNFQYRMHPEIARFPSLHFYNGKLLNGENMSTKKVPFHKIEVLGPYVFFDVVGGQELRGKNSGALSFYNECEADAAVELLRFFKQRYCICLFF